MELILGTPINIDEGKCGFCGELSEKCFISPIQMPGGHKDINQVKRGRWRQGMFGLDKYIDVIVDRKFERIKLDAIALCVKCVKQLYKLTK